MRDSVYINMNTNSNKAPKLTFDSYVRDLPFGVRRKLGMMLDPGDALEKLISIIPADPDMLLQDSITDYDLRFCI